MPDRLTVEGHTLRAGLSQNDFEIHSGFLKQASDVGSRIILVQDPPGAQHKKFVASLNRLQKLGYILYSRDREGKKFEITIIKE